MNITKHKFKLFFSLSYNDHRKFYWFELKGNDLYWGNSSNVKETPTILKKSSLGSLSFKLPDEFEGIQESKSKYSYHESGVFHKRTHSGITYSIRNIEKKWPQKDSLVYPFCFFSVLSKPILSYPKETKKLPIKNVKAHSHLFEGEKSKSRVYFDFFIAQKNNIEYKLKNKILVDSKFIQHRIVHLSDSYDLIYRYIIFEKIDKIFPQNELFFLDE